MVVKTQVSQQDRTAPGHYFLYQLQKHKIQLVQLKSLIDLKISHILNSQISYIFFPLRSHFKDVLSFTS